MELYEVLRRPLLTEKTELMSVDNKYAFEVHKRASKTEVREAIESIFEVKVTRVRTMIMPGKTRRWGRKVRHTSSWKKAIVTLQEGDMIEIQG